MHKPAAECSRRRCTSGDKLGVLLRTMGAGRVCEGSGRIREGSAPSDLLLADVQVLSPLRLAATLLEDRLCRWSQMSLTRFAIVVLLRSRGTASS